MDDEQITKRRELAIQETHRAHQIVDALVAGLQQQDSPMERTDFALASMVTATARALSVWMSPQEAAEVLRRGADKIEREASGDDRRRPN